MKVLKANGRIEDFDTRKLEGTLRRAGASKEAARDITREVLAWHSPENEGLETLIDRKRLYPLSAIHRIKPETVNAFSRAGLMLMKDLLDKDIDALRKTTGISGKTLRFLVKEAKQVCLG